MAKIDMAFFPSVEGSMTSEVGHIFMLHVKRPTRGDLMLGLPHSEIPNIVENAAVQAAHGRDASGKKDGRGPQGLIVQGEPRAGRQASPVGQAGAISFLLPPHMARQLSEMLQKLAN